MTQKINSIIKGKSFYFYFYEYDYIFMGTELDKNFLNSTRRSTNQSATREYTGRIASDGQKADAVKRAEELQRDLNSHHPSFIKPMVRSHVSGGFWLVS